MPCWHQVIFLTNVHTPSNVFSGIHLKATKRTMKEELMNVKFNICLEITPLLYWLSMYYGYTKKILKFWIFKIATTPPGTNKLRLQHQLWHFWIYFHGCFALLKEQFTYKPLTHWPPKFSGWWRWPKMHVIVPYWSQVSIGSGNGLVPPGIKPLPESMLTQFYVVIWRH